MVYDISLNLPAGWTCEQDTFLDETGYEITHLEAHLRNDRAQADDALINIYVGDTPEGETAEDQAFANYAETVGFYEDDPEDFNPIEKFLFNGRNAYGFQALAEDDSPLRFISQEVRKGVLAIIVFNAKDELTLKQVSDLIEHNFRIRK
ncbi:MAG: hypothetical protein MJY50_02855 [Bacteroidales bacterium]|nr:hypothetical protein [Bacteroidales bacterium]